MTVIWIFLSFDENNGLTIESVDASNNRFFNGSAIFDGQTT